MNHIKLYLAELEETLTQHEFIAQSLREQISLLKGLYGIPYEPVNNTPVLVQQEPDNRIFKVTTVETPDGNSRVSMLNVKEKNNDRSTIQELISLALLELGGCQSTITLYNEIKKIRKDLLQNSMYSALDRMLKAGVLKRIKKPNNRENFWCFNEEVTRVQSNEKLDDSAYTTEGGTKRVYTDPKGRSSAPRTNMGFGAATIKLFNDNLNKEFSSKTIIDHLEEQYPDVTMNTSSATLSTMFQKEIPGFKRRKYGAHYYYVATQSIDGDNFKW